MRVPRLPPLARLSLLLVAGAIGPRQMMAATPGVTISASNVSVTGQGSGVSQFTVTSVNGYAGQVAVSCTGPSSGLTELVLPDCDHPVQNYAVAGNGTATGTMNFVPPWADNAAWNSSGGRGKPERLPIPMASAFAGLGLLALRLRKAAHRRASLLLSALCLASLFGFTSCLGHGGLAMTPGTYAYTLSATSVSGPSASASTAISVTVTCDSCP